MEQYGSSSGSYPEGRRFKSFSCYQFNTPPLWGGFSFGGIMSQPLYPKLAHPSSAELLVLFATPKDGGLGNLVLSNDRGCLRPLISYEGEAVPPMDRRSRLLIEASSVGLVVLDEDWVFLGWQQDKEIWLGFSRVWLSRPPQQIICLTPIQLDEVIKEGVIHTSVQSSLANPQNYLAAGYRTRIQPWLADLAKQMGWVAKPYESH